MQDWSQLLWCATKQSFYDNCLILKHSTHCKTVGPEADFDRRAKLYYHWSHVPATAYLESGQCLCIVLGTEWVIVTITTQLDCLVDVHGWVYLPNVREITVVAFPLLVYLTIWCIEWYWLSTHKLFLLGYSNVNESWESSRKLRLDK
jgi:hypothetical protein